MKRMTVTSKLGRFCLGDFSYIMEDRYYHNVRFGDGVGFGRFTVDEEGNSVAVFSSGECDSYFGFPVERGHNIGLVPEELWDHSMLELEIFKNMMIFINANEATVEIHGEYSSGALIIIKADGEVIKRIEITPEYATGLVPVEYKEDEGEVEEI